MATEIVLPVGASAEPNTCGSCKFFRRTMDAGDYAMRSGTCGFVLPPKLAQMFAARPSKDDDEWGWRLPDTQRCDLQRPDGKAYIVQRRVGVVTL